MLDVPRFLHEHGHVPRTCAHKFPQRCLVQPDTCMHACNFSSAERRASSWTACTPWRRRTVGRGPPTGCTTYPQLHSLISFTALTAKQVIMTAFFCVGWNQGCIPLGSRERGTWCIHRGSREPGTWSMSQGSRERQAPSLSRVGPVEPRTGSTLFKAECL